MEVEPLKCCCRHPHSRLKNKEKKRRATRALCVSPLTTRGQREAKQCSSSHSIVTQERDNVKRKERKIGRKKIKKISSNT